MQLPPPLLVTFELRRIIIFNFCTVFKTMFTQNLSDIMINDAHDLFFTCYVWCCDWVWDIHLLKLRSKKVNLLSTCIITIIELISMKGSSSHLLEAINPVSFCSNLKQSRICGSPSVFNIWERKLSFISEGG